MQSQVVEGRLCAELSKRAAIVVEVASHPWNAADRNATRQFPVCGATLKGNLVFPNRTKKRMPDPSDSEICHPVRHPALSSFLTVLTTPSVRFGGAPLCPEEPPWRLLNVQDMPLPLLLLPSPDSVGLRRKDIFERRKRFILQVQSSLLCKLHSVFCVRFCILANFSTRRTRRLMLEKK